MDQLPARVLVVRRAVVVARRAVHATSWLAASVLVVTSSVVGAVPGAADEGARFTLADASSSLAGDVRVERLLETLERSRREGLALVAQRLGLEPGAREIRWTLEEALSGSGEVAGLHHLARTEIRPEGIVVRVPASRYLARVAKVRDVVVHECVHAVIASHATVERWESIPFWLREGLAVELAGEGERRLDGEIVIEALAGRDRGSFLLGISGARDPSYAESWLAVRLVLERVGDEGLRALVTRTLAGASIDVVLRDLVGVDSAGFARSASRHARERLRERAPGEHLDRLRRSVGLLARGERELARELLSAELLSSREAQGARRGLVATASYLLARSRVDELEAGRGTETAEVESDLRALIEGEHEGLWEAEALEQLGRLARLGGRHDDARRAWREVLERFPDDEDVAARVRAALRALPRDPGVSPGPDAR